MIDNNKSFWSMSEGQLLQARLLVPEPTLPENYLRLADMVAEYDLDLSSPTPPANLAPFYPHLKLKENGDIAVVYTETVRRGIEDRRTVTTLGKFFERFSNSPRCSSELVMAYAYGLFSNLSDIVKFAITADEIKRVYVGGPESCMDRKVLMGSLHPCMAYAYPLHRTEIDPTTRNTLAVAYIGNIDSAELRVVVDWEGKFYSKVYGGNTTKMSLILDAIGWQRSSKLTAGQFLSKIEFGENEYLLPYLDDRLPVVMDGDHFCVHSDREAIGKQTYSCGVTSY